MVRAVTSRNNNYVKKYMDKANSKTPGFNLRCAATGLFLSSATDNFEVISVTHKQARAFEFPCDESVEFGRRAMRTFYGSFDWQSVSVEG